MRGKGKVIAFRELAATVTSKDYSFTRLTLSTSHGPAGYRITQVANAGANGTLTYAYPDFDDAGRRLKMTRGDTTSTALDPNAYWAYTYNNKGELASGKKKDASNNAFPGLNNEYTYDSIGNRTEWKTGGDTSGANLRSIPYTANNLNQYTSIDSASSPDYDVTGDAVAAGTVTVDGNATGRRGAWFHREIATNNNSVAVYATNLVRVVNAGVTNSTNVVTFVAQDPEAPLYDDDGNLTRDGRWVYTWTGENRLRRMETRTDLPAAVPRINLELKYDHLGRRIMKQVKEGATVLETRYYVWNGWQLIWELNETFGFRKAFEWGPDVSHTLEGAGTVGGLLHVMDVSGAWDSWVSFPCYDGNGNVMGLVGYAYGNILCKYEYDPYGKLIRTSGNTTLAASNPFLFSTKFLDRETGLSYYGYRYYSAEKGRWVNHDPIGELGHVVSVIPNAKKCLEQTGLFSKIPAATLKAPKKFYPKTDTVYNFAYNSPSMLVDMDGRDIYTMKGNNARSCCGSSRNRVNNALHIGVCVDTYTVDALRRLKRGEEVEPTGRSCFSFGKDQAGLYGPKTTWLGWKSFTFACLEGSIYVQSHTTGTVLRRHITRPDQDVKWLTYMFSTRVGTKDGYSVGRHNCRKYSNMEFDDAPSHYGP